MPFFSSLPECGITADATQGDSREERAVPEDPLGDELARQMGKIARSLQTEEGDTGILGARTKAAVELIPGVQEASITLVLVRKKVETRARSGQVAQEADALQE